MPEGRWGLDWALRTVERIHGRRHQRAVGGRLRVLLVMHDASRSGAPLMVLKLLRWMATHDRFAPVVLAVRGGPLIGDLRSLAPVVAPSAHVSRRGRRGLVSFDRLRDRLRMRIALHRLGPFDVVLSSTLTNGVALQRFTSQATSVVCRASELAHLLDRHVDELAVQASLRRSCHVIAVSDAVRRELTGLHGVADEKISVISGFIDDSTTDPLTARCESRRQLHIAPTAFVVGAVGAVSWHKGADLFLHVARMNRSDPSVDFVWIGGDGGSRADIDYDIDHGSVGNVRFVGEHADAATLLAAFDVLLVTSRVDSFPVAMLEAAAMGVPTVCFRNSGGAAEFTDRGGGIAVEYTDVRAMAAVVRELRNDPKRLEALGTSSRRTVQGYRAEVIGSQIGDLLARAAKFGDAM